MSTIQANAHAETRRLPRRFMRTGCVVALIAAPVVVYAQGGAASPPTGRVPADGQQEQKGTRAKARRLEAVTWNPVTEELTWVVSSGDRSAGAYKSGGEETYKIHMDDAIMGFEGERRRFSPEEAKQVHKLMDLISRYAVESTIWWEHGEGEKLDDRGDPVPGDKDQRDEDKAHKKPAPIRRGVPIAATPGPGGTGHRSGIRLPATDAAAAAGPAARTGSL